MRLIRWVEGAPCPHPAHMKESECFNALCEGGEGLTCEAFNCVCGYVTDTCRCSPVYERFVPGTGRLNHMNPDEYDEMKLVRNNLQTQLTEASSGSGTPQPHSSQPLLHTSPPQPTHHPAFTHTHHPSPLTGSGSAPQQLSLQQRSFDNTLLEFGMGHTGVSPGCNHSGRFPTGRIQWYGECLESSVCDEPQSWPCACNGSNQAHAPHPHAHAPRPRAHAPHTQTPRIRMRPITHSVTHSVTHMISTWTVFTHQYFQVLAQLLEHGPLLGYWIMHLTLPPSHIPPVLEVRPQAKKQRPTPRLCHAPRRYPDLEHMYCVSAWKTPRRQRVDPIIPLCDDCGWYVEVGTVVHVPSKAFPDDRAPPDGFWPGKTVYTIQGGRLDIGIKIDREEIFTRPRAEVWGWQVHTYGGHITCGAAQCPNTPVSPPASPPCSPPSTAKRHPFVIETDSSESEAVAVEEREAQANEAARARWLESVPRATSTTRTAEERVIAAKDIKDTAQRRAWWSAARDRDARPEAVESNSGTGKTRSPSYGLV